MNADILQKYSVAIPRYTSYPTVPHWDKSSFNLAVWKKQVQEAFFQSNDKTGISLYIHLPYCENLCTYCACNKRITKNHQVELPYINAVIAEWNIYKKLFKGIPNIKEIHLGGGTPTFFSPENLEILINGILENCDIHPEAEYSFEAHPSNTTYQHLKTLFNLGFRRLSLGIQDFDLTVQKIINRVQSVEEVKSVTEQARTIGYASINYDLIYGLPLQTIKSLKETIEKVVDLKPDRIAFYGYAHVPWVKSGQRKFTEDDLPNTQTRQLLYETGRNQLSAAGYFDIGMDHFSLTTDSLYKAAQNQKIHRNFMGYTHQYTQLMIGLGVSSISDSWYAFAQNVKNEEEYLSLIENGEFPVFKGHLLTDEDLLLRKHILNIMCNLETTWTKEELANHNFKNSICLLDELIADGIITRTDYSLKVTDEGKRFLRNVCAVFDVRLREKLPEKQVFSLA